MGLSEDIMTTPTKWAEAFLVNTTTDGDQATPSAAGLADGRSVIAWVAEDGDGVFAIQVQVFGASGAKDGGEITVIDSESTRFDAQTTSLADGGFLVSWTSKNVFTGESAAFAQVFASDGSASGDAFAVGTPVDGTPVFPQIEQMADGRLLAVWIEYSESGAGPDGDSTGVYAQIIGLDGSADAGPFLVNTTTTYDQTEHAIAMLGNGGFVITWQDESEAGADESGRGVYAQIFDADGGKIGGEIPVNTETTNDQRSPTITALANGRFVVAWEDQSKGGNSFLEVRAQVFNPDGSKHGVEFVVNTTNTSYQDQPTIAALDDGGFMAVWRDGSSGADSDIRAQRFDADGNALGFEFVVTTIIDKDQDSPSISVLADGRVMVAWTDRSESADDPSGPAVRAQILDPRDQAMNHFGSPLDDQLVGTVFADLIEGRSGKDMLWGHNGNDVIRGEGGDDKLKGGLGNDLIDGGKGRDKLTGDGGADTFFFDNLKDSKVKSKDRDVIRDFDATEGDIIDLAGIDAKEGGSDSDFKFIGTAGFSDTKGELRYAEKADKVIVKGDVDGDGEADFAIKVKGVTSLAEDDFVL